MFRDDESLIRFDAPADSWLAAAPLGNGRLGALVHGRPGSELVQLNDGTAWSGSPASAGEPVAEGPQLLAQAREALSRDDFDAATRAVQQLQSGWSQAYLPFADLLIASRLSGSAAEAEVSDYRRTLHLRTAETVTHYRLDGSRVSWRSFVSAADLALVIRIESEADLDLELSLESCLSSLGVESRPRFARMALLLPSDVPPPHEPDHEIRWSTAEGAALRGVVYASWRHDGLEAPGGMRATGVRRATLVITTATTFVAAGVPPRGSVASIAEHARETARRALARSSGELTRRHRGNYAALFDRVELHLGAGAAAPGPAAADPAAAAAAAGSDPGPDSGLSTWAQLAADNSGAVARFSTLLFHFGRYLLISSSRPGGLPATLQGLWNTRLRAPWSSNYTLNINTQMNYWAAEAVGLAECVEPLFDLVDALQVTGGRTAALLYDAPGWVAHHNTDAWAYPLPVGTTTADPAWAFWPMAQHWLVAQLMEHVRYTDDRQFAWTRAWPAVLGAAEFALQQLVPAPDGSLGTSPSTSPENHFLTPDGSPCSVGRSSTMDLALIRATLESLLDLAALLNRDDEVIARARHALTRLPALRPGSDGLIPEWLADAPQAEPHHRHLSHLWALYPGPGLPPSLHAAASRSLDARGDDSTGWSLAWKTALRARLGQGHKVADLLRLALRPAPISDDVQQGGLYPNLFAAHPPFQIDGNLGFVAGVVEALLQSHDGTIHLLPAVPDEWCTGSVRGLIARPGVAVDLRWAADARGRAVLGTATLTPLTERARSVVTVRWGGRSCEVDLAAGPATITTADLHEGSHD